MSGAEPGDFGFFRNSRLTEPGALFSSTNEPSVGKNHNAVLYTGNWYGALSADAGQTWDFIDPFDSFPADGRYDDVTGNLGWFCCDQVVLDAPSQNMVVWYLQYTCGLATVADESRCDAPGEENAQRLVVFLGPDHLVNGTADCSYLLYPSQAGFVGGYWYDHPQLSRSNAHLFVTTDVFSSDLSSEQAYSVVMRFSLSDLASCPNGSIGYDTFQNGGQDEWIGFTPVSGASSTMYFGTDWSAAESDNALSSQFAVYAWPDASSAVSRTVRTVSQWPTTLGDGAFCVGPDGNNACGRIDQRVEAGWVAAGTVGFMFMAKEDAPDRPYPYTRVVQFAEGDLSFASDFDIFNSTNAYIYPAVAVNDRGHLGATIVVAGGTWNPSSAFWIWDDFQPIGPGFTVIPGEQGTNGPSSHRWGDYLTSRGDGDTWLATGFTLQGPDCPEGTCSSVEPRLYSFGRERDRPEPVPTSTPSTLRGDANCDGRINSIDAALILQYAAGLIRSLPCAQGADANHDGRVNSIDAALVLQYVAGIIDEL